MKHEILQERLRKMGGVPVYQCPHCQTVWLIAGGQHMASYVCTACERAFVPAAARYGQANTSPEISSVLLPKAA